MSLYQEVRCSTYKTTCMKTKTTYGAYQADLCAPQIFSIVIQIFLGHHLISVLCLILIMDNCQYTKYTNLTRYSLLYETEIKCDENSSLEQNTHNLQGKGGKLCPDTECVPKKLSKRHFITKTISSNNHF